MNELTTIFAGEIFDGRDAAHPLIKLRTGETVLARVREMPARHHLEVLALFQVGKEAELIERCVQRGEIKDGGAIEWQPATAAFVDDLDEESHVLLVDVCDRLNFDRAIRTAQRQIARGETLRPLMETMTKQVMEPMRKELGSWMSSLTTQISAALAAKKS